MNTRDALSRLSGEKRQRVGPLDAHAERYTKAYDERQAALLARRGENQVFQPVVNAIKRKVASITGGQDGGTPIAMRFDAFQAAKQAVMQDPHDRGVVHLAQQLESFWHQEPMGSVTLDQLLTLRNHYQGNYPKSAAIKVINVEIPKVGYNTLPIAKLARLAARINDQEDFDYIVMSAGLAGDRIDQVRARALIRELVALKGAQVESGEPVQKDARSNEERAAQRVAQELGLGDDFLDAPPGDLGGGMGDEPPLELDMEAEPPVGDVPPGGGDVQEEVEGISDFAEEVSEFIQENAPPVAEPYIQLEQEETATPENPEGLLAGTPEWGFSEAQEGHSAPPPSREWQQEELEEHGVTPDAAPAGPGGMEEMGPPGEVMDEGPMDLGPPMDDEEGLPMAAHLKQAKSPPGWEKWIEHRKSEGMDPSTAFATAWSKHNKGQTPHNQSKKKASKSSSKPSKEGCGDRFGISKPDPTGHTPIQTSAPKKQMTGPGLLKGSGRRITASDIESALLDRGEVVKVGDVSIHINQGDEVELWVKDAGRVCDLKYIDTAIHDFIKYANDEIRPNINRKGGFWVVDLLPVPCAKCASVSYFEPVDPAEGIYACDCGHQTMASVVDTLVEHGQLTPTKFVSVRLPQQYANDPKVAEDFANKIVAHVSKQATVVDVDRAPNHMLVKVHAAGLTSDGVGDLANMLSRHGVRQFNAQALDPSAISAPGSADMPLKEDVKPQSVTPSDGGQAGSDNPEGETHQEPHISAAFTHYKDMGLGLLEAVKQFVKDYSEWIENHATPETEASVLQSIVQLYSNMPLNQDGPVAGSEGPQAPQPPEGGMGEDLGIPPPGAGATATGPQAPAPGVSKPMQAMARKLLRAAFKAPKVNAQQPDAVSVPKQPLGGEKDNDTGHPGGLKQPGIKVKHPAKQKSPTDMGGTNEEKDPGRFGASKPPRGGQGDKNKPGHQPGTKTPSTGMHGKDSDNNPKLTIPTPGKYGPRPAHS